MRPSNDNFIDSNKGHIISIAGNFRNDLKRTLFVDVGFNSDFLRLLVSRCDFIILWHIDFSFEIRGGLQRLQQLSSLQELNVTATRVTNQAIEALKSSRPRLMVIH